MELGRMSLDDSESVPNLIDDSRSVFVHGKCSPSGSSAKALEAGQSSLGSRLGHSTSTSSATFKMPVPQGVDNWRLMLRPENLPAGSKLHGRMKSSKMDQSAIARALQERGKRCASEKQG